MSTLMTPPAPLSADWKVLLDEEEVAIAAACLQRIGQALEQWYRQERSRTAPTWTLGSGLAGTSLLFDYLDRAFPNQGYAGLSREMFATAYEAAETASASPSLLAGLSGLAWADAHLAKRSGELMGDYSEFDVAIEGLLTNWSPQGPFDHVSGLAGIGLYLLERQPDTRCLAALDELTGRLCAAARRTESGFGWFTDAQLLVPSARPKNPSGCFDLGVAHGNAGVLGFLSAVVAASVGGVRARTYVEGSARWLLAQRCEDRQRGWFGTESGGSAPPMVTRSTWCYGDAGAACCLWLAGQALSNQELLAAATELSSLCLTRGTTDLRDACLCHGSAGLLHMYVRWAHRSPPLSPLDTARAASTQLRHIQSQQIMSPECAGFTFVRGPWRGSIWGLLEGITGVGLALLAASTPIEPCWDRMLLIA